MTEQRENEEALKEKTKRLSIKDGSGYSVMDGFGLRYMTPYALALGASNTQIGFLTSIPNLLGNLFQLFTSKLMERYSRKKLVVFGAILQTIMWLPLIGIGFFFFYRGLGSGTSSSLLIVIYTLLIIFSAFLSPAWNSLMNDIVTKDKGAYFGRRNRTVGTVALISLLIGGFILDYFKNTKLFIGFCIIFGLAFIGRSFSAYTVAKHYEPELKLEKGYYFSFKQFLMKIPKSNYGKFALFTGLMMFVASIASPFFSVYMLKELNFSYVSWMLVTVANSLASLLFMPLWGKIADKYGNLRVLKITGIFIPFASALWVASPLIVKMHPNLLIFYLISVEFMSGIVWSGFNLSAVNFIFDAVTRQRVPLCVAYYNVMNGIGIFFGATLGGIISSKSFIFFGLSPLLFVFLLSGVLRFVIYLIMIPMLKEVRETEKYENGAVRKELKDGLKKEVREGFMYLSYKWIRPRPT